MTILVCGILSVELPVKLKIRKISAIVEDHYPGPHVAETNVLRKVGAYAVVENPYAGRYEADLKPLIEASVELGQLLAKRAVEAMGGFAAQSYGKGGISGLAGEQEHANALLTTAFANPLREMIGGGKAWISSVTKAGGPGTTIDIPLASKDALYVRSHYDAMSLTLNDCPLPNEVAVMVCLASGARHGARVGGLALKDIKGVDGLT
jgi:hypothetical protein